MPLLQEGSSHTGSRNGGGNGRGNGSWGGPVDATEGGGGLPRSSSLLGRRWEEKEYFVLSHAILFNVVLLCIVLHCALPCCLLSCCTTTRCLVVLVHFGVACE